MLSKEVIRRKDWRCGNVFWLMLERFNYILYLPCRLKAKDKMNLLRPPTSFYNFTYLIGFTTCWALACLLNGSYSSNPFDFGSIGAAIAWLLFLTVVSSLLNLASTLAFLKFFNRDLKKVFR